MNSTISDVIVHTQTLLSDAQFAALSDQMYRQPGIVSITRNLHRPKLVMVVYDAARTRALHILETVRRQGIGAVLVGL